MKKLVIASTGKNAGKTSIIAGLAKVLDRGFTYIKPFGDKLYFRKKVLWDHDAVLMTAIFGIDENPEYLSVGFNHRKIRYLYDETSIREKLNSMIRDVSGGKEIIFVECGEDLACGAFAWLDAVSVARAVKGELIVVAGGDDASIMDDLTFLGGNVKLPEGMFRGVIINKVENIEDFRTTCTGPIGDMGLDILGVIPFESGLTYLTGRVVAERLFAKIIAGEQGLDNPVRGIFIAAMTAHALQESPAFKKERDKLVITAGDRNDLIIAAMDSATTCIVITNNIMPATHVISKADERGIPLVLVAEETFQTAGQIESIVPTVTPHDTRKLELLAELVKTHVDMAKLMAP